MTTLKRIANARLFCCVLFAAVLVLVYKLYWPRSPEEEVAKMRSRASVLRAHAAQDLNEADALERFARSFEDEARWSDTSRPLSFSEWVRLRNR